MDREEEQEHGDEGEDGVDGGEGAGRDEAEEMAGVGDDTEANIVGKKEDSNDKEETEDAFAASFYQESLKLENSHIAIDDEEDWEEETAPFFNRIFQVWIIRKLCWNGSMMFVQ